MRSWRHLPSPQPRTGERAPPTPQGDAPSNLLLIGDASDWQVQSEVRTLQVRRKGVKCIMNKIKIKDQNKVLNKGQQLQETRFVKHTNRKVIKLENITHCNQNSPDKYIYVPVLYVSLELLCSPERRKMKVRFTFFSFCFFCGEINISSSALNNFCRWSRNKFYFALNIICII